MFGLHYERALGGEHCWLRHEDGATAPLPVNSWLGGAGADAHFDDELIAMCQGPTIDLGCGPGRLVARLVRRGIPALGVDISPAAIGIARDNGAPALHRDVFDRLPGAGRWHTVLLADGNVGIGGDPWRVLRRAAELLGEGGRCLAEFDSCATGVDVNWVRLESRDGPGPWFRWARVGAERAESVAAEVGLTVVDMRRLNGRSVATLVPR